MAEAGAHRSSVQAVHVAVAEHQAVREDVPDEGVPGAPVREGPVAILQDELVRVGAVEVDDPQRTPLLEDHGATVAVLPTRSIESDRRSFASRDERGRRRWIRVFAWSHPFEPPRHRSRRGAGTTPYPSGIDPWSEGLARPIPRIVGTLSYQKSRGPQPSIGAGGLEFESRHASFGTACLLRFGPTSESPRPIVSALDEGS